MGYINMKCTESYSERDNERMLRVITEMKHVFETVPYGVAHTINVLENAERIMAGEGMTEALREQTRLAAVLHDIGAIKALEVHGSMSGKYQEIEGPAIAKEILVKAGYAQSVIERVCYIVGHHHTEQAIDGEDFQILWEADAIENLRVMIPREGMTEYAESLVESIKTGVGKMLLAEQLELQRREKR